ncbi:hypothetical protein [Sebaldella sp. S0638]|uniref:hypothetical protein n=1 Tax=Sebaldella sp. S0638 TaxID=2957809 RepID=UPI00209E051D|nr:hypothetical protein [Sebaldella sp. S0638]MCP1226591.1 hypothetical protein [Sebaldella sp. S0638]
MRENKKTVKVLLKELVELLEENYTSGIDKRISDVYYLLSLYSLEIIPFERLRKDSFLVLKEWTASEAFGHNPFYIPKETPEETRMINEEYKEIMEKLRVEFEKIM